MTYIALLKKCPLCEHKSVVKMTFRDLTKYWQDKEPVSKIFQERPASEREILISGICRKCQQEIFK